MSDKKRPDILYTIVDEAPQLASVSLLPIIQSFASTVDVTVGTRDISLAGRILATVPEFLTEGQRQSDDLAVLGELVKTPEANVIKLPNVSASIPQLSAAISELQVQGFAVPDYPENPQTEAEKSLQARYDAIKGSAVNPVLREGNSDRRSARAVKNYAMKNPHSMGAWASTSKTHVASMPGNDFYANEKSATISAAQAGKAKIEFVDTAGKVSLLKGDLNLLEGTVVDATFMSATALRAFIRNEIVDAAAQGVLFSVHLKATMMKVSDPIIFGHFVYVYLEDVFTKHADVLAELGANPNNGIGDLLAKIDGLPADKKAEIAADIEASMAAKPPLYMVDSDKGITNLHVSSDVIIDASLPALIRAGGKSWGPDGKAADTKCVVPDNCYAGIYDETINYFKETGALDPTTSGSVSNVGLMAQKAEEYGSHPTTFEAPANGTIRYVLANGETLHSHEVAAGDIWRSSSANAAPIKDWVKLGISRQKATGSAAVFWLDENRAHDAQLIKAVKAILTEEGANDLGLQIMAPREATRYSLELIRQGKDVISITGNVLRDYLTDLFPILELGTSAKMLSIVKLMNGGGMFETGAGGSAPKHVQQLVSEGHLRWDSLGEFCALGESLTFLAESKGDPRVAVLGRAVDDATEKLLDTGKSPGRKVGQLDNRDSHYFFALYWAEALAAQTDDADLAAHFAPIAAELAAKQDVILAELSATQGQAADLGGYYHTDLEKTVAVMRPSATFNAIVG
ncbi:NADP-dependent isocitrate dehydrogenase [Falsihalocynthiibacter arcticus]|uniref:Isocitrate dehydrogenase [NADP] n=1 Tax=Falsihalocynthiibacter arcticus TaxID=1579316 RepID=A0A126V5K9_9RHOB|nr:NADP-dependent isocitrate dehydrogenase [Falsihalocynthiibacter arcticus]AML53563.1 isocitrate dehydrogenase [Falsihalocynthiibacter arcticus]